MTLRILIGAESVADAPRALQLLPVLSEGTSAFFGGLLVVNQAAHEQGGSSQRVVTASGKVVKAPDAQALQRIVESETRAFRKMLAETAKTTGADWSAEVKIGTLAPNLAAVANAWDIVVVGHRMLHQRQGRVVILGDALQTDSEVIAVAARMATELKTDLERLERPSGGDQQSDWFSEKLDRLSVAAVVLDASTAPFSGFGQLARLLTVARCPIVVLRSTQLQPRLEHNLLITPPPEQGT